MSKHRAELLTGERDESANWRKSILDELYMQSLILHSTRSDNQK